jgi:hypothetical protein
MVFAPKSTWNGVPHQVMGVLRHIPPAPVPHATLPTGRCVGEAFPNVGSNPSHTRPMQGVCRCSVDVC